jgi:hydroxymethylbilane synthase
VRVEARERIRILSRASDLARLQAFLVGRAIEARFPDIEATYFTRVAAGDRDVTTPLTALVDKGAFTSDLSDGLASGEADAVVHSWKDLPLEGRAGTSIVATLERADPRDVLLVRRDVAAQQPAALNILSSSPRRTWLLQQALPALLPWRVETLRFVPVRGNIHTRLTRLIEGRGDALVVAKAALDRLLGFGVEFEDAAAAMRELLAQCRWMVLPAREVPGAPAQGALAVEVARDSRWADRLRAISHDPTWHAVMKEREVLASYGGGCHQALGATVLPREYGQIVSVRGRSETGRMDERWSLVDDRITQPAVDESRIWPRPSERRRAMRRALDPAQPSSDAGYWIARAEALPKTWTVNPERLIWTAGSTTWRRLAARGVWVHGCADGLGDDEPPPVDALAGRSVTWRRLTHEAAASHDRSAIATYMVDDPLPDDLSTRTHFFWTSGTLFREAVARWPAVRDGWHGSGPGRTRRAIRTLLASSDRAGVWLDYEDWRKDVLGWQ